VEEERGCGEVWGGGWGCGVGVGVVWGEGGGGGGGGGGWGEGDLVRTVRIAGGNVGNQGFGRAVRLFMRFGDARNG
jgi:hypothetical protein